MISCRLALEGPGLQRHDRNWFSEIVAAHRRGATLVQKVQEGAGLDIWGGTAVEGTGR